MSMKILIFCVGISLLVSGHAQAYSVSVHDKMSRSAYKQSVLDPANGTYLTMLGLTANQSIKGKTVEDQIADGSDFEDNGWRAFNHFYDPTTGQGLLDLPNFIATDAINWGLELQPCDIFHLNCGTLTQEWSIPDGRNYFYTALTDPDPTVREANWANTFQALGHVIHLIQDMGQPQHVRNDPHFEEGFLYGTPLSFLNFDHSRYEEYTRNPIRIGSLAYSGYPVVNFNDYFSYWTGGGYGLADFTNRNFFSERYSILCNGDICAEQGYALPFISRASGVDQTVDVQTQTDGTKTGVMTFYPYTFVDPLTGEVVTNPRVLSHSVFDLDLLNIGQWPLFSQNKYTFEESQKILIKRAVGYSAGLLDYFFRGQLEVTPVQGGLKVKNASSETMDAYYDPAAGGTIGDLLVYYDDLNQTRHFLADYPLPSPLNPGEETDVIPFTRPADNLKPGQYIVVFQGKLGTEEGAVIGKVTPPQKIYYASKRGGIYKIYSMDTDGSSPAMVYDNPDPNITISKLAPSPDGKTLAFTVNGPRIYLLDLTSHSLSQLTLGDWPDWSPDGTKIAFERDVVSTGAQIFIRDLRTGSEVQLTPTSLDTHPVSSRHPTFSPDGGKIAFSIGYPDGEGCSPVSFAIYLMDTSGNYLGPLTCDSQGPWIDEAPAWSPDGREIAFTRRWDRQSSYPLEKLHKVSIGTKAVTKLTNADWTTYSELTPAWSSDGKYIAIGSNQDGDFDIWLVDRNGAGYLSNLTNANPEIDGYPAFLK